MDRKRAEKLASIMKAYAEGKAAAMAVDAVKAKFDREFFESINKIPGKPINSTASHDCLNPPL